MRFALIIFALALSAASIAVGISVGYADAGLGDLLSWLGGRSSPDGRMDLLMTIRLPRVLTAFLAGALLAAVGGAYQGIFRNPLADPFVTGVSTCSALGAVVALVLGVELMEPLALAFGVASAIVVLRLASVRGRIPVLNLLLAGFAVGTLASALLSLLIYAKSRDAGQIVTWLMGNLSGASWNGVLLLLTAAVVLLTLLATQARALNLLSLGEEQARTMGVASERVKILLLIAGSCAVALTVCSCGVIGFVGLIVPHVVRLLSGPDHRVLLPVSALLGGSLLCLSDAAARVAIAPAEVPVGILTSLLGLPFFLYLLRTRAAR